MALYFRNGDLNKFQFSEEKGGVCLYGKTFRLFYYLMKFNLK